MNLRTRHQFFPSSKMTKQCTRHRTPVEVCLSEQRLGTKKTAVPASSERSKVLLQAGTEDVRHHPVGLMAK